MGTLHPEVLAWVAKDVQTSLRGEDRLAFMKKLRFHPDEVAAWLKSALPERLERAIFHAATGNMDMVCVNDHDAAAREIVEYFQTYFAEELPPATSS